MAAKVASARKCAVAGPALMCFLLLAVVDGGGSVHLGHTHVGDGPHVLHIGKALDVHGGWHGAWNMHGSLHDGG